MKKIISTVLALILISFSITSCASKQSAIAVTNYPVQYLVERIAEKTVVVNNLSVGDYYQQMELREDASTILKDSDAIFYIRELEPYFDELRPQLSKGNLKLVNLANANSVYNFSRYSKVENEEGNVEFIEEPYYLGEMFESIDMYQKDPMLWMDPITMSAMGATVKDYLVGRYPENAEIYERNFAKLELELAQLDSKYQTFVRNERTIKFAVMAPNFGNWQKSYGMEVYPIILADNGDVPYEDQLDAIRVRLIQDGVIYMAVEQGLPPEVEQLQNQLIRELGLTPFPLNSFAYTSYTEVGTTLDYLGIMYQNYNQLEAIAY